MKFGLPALMVSLLSGTALGEELDREPYLQSLTPYQVTLVWRGEQMHDAEVVVEGSAQSTREATTPASSCNMRWCSMA